MEFKTIADVRAANKASGHHWFDRSTMKIFGSRVESGLYGGKYFISSELDFHGNDRRYTIRIARANGEIADGSDFRQFAFIEDARDEARKLARLVTA